MIQNKLKKDILWLTTTALFIALIIAVQAAGAGIGQPIVGPLVNLILIIAVMSNGPLSGLTVSLLSPVFAKLLGIGPVWAIVPFLMVGNAVLVMIWLMAGMGGNKFLMRLAAVVVAAACKCAALYIGVVKIMVPLFLHLPAPQAAVISNMFALPQFLTALAGGAMAMAVLPVIEKIRAKK